MTLSDLDVGTYATIKSIFGNNEFKYRLLDMGLTPNTLVKIQKIAPFHDPIEIKVRDYELVIRKKEARQIEVKVIK